MAVAVPHQGHVLGTTLIVAFTLIGIKPDCVVSTVPAIAAPTTPATAPATNYDPLHIPAGFTAITLDLNVQDTEQGRSVPLRVYYGGIQSPAPIVLFSHGLGGSRSNNAFLGRHWAARGYIAVFMQHAGSDESVWRDKTPRQIVSSMKQAANGENFQFRVQDVRAVLDQFERWNREAGHPLFGRLDKANVGMSGHSFGALTTQAVSGQNFPQGISLTDSRIKAACMFSPSSPANAAGGNTGEGTKRAFGSVKIPWLLMTGTNDGSPRQGVDLASRLAVYPALPPGKKYEVVLDGAQHSAFSDRALPAEGGVVGNKPLRNPNHHRVILALTTAFWDAYLKDDMAARTWLDGVGPSSVLEKGDRWQKK